uniref:Protein phosphatase, Mg2+/Mn2+ dependent 1L n=1 Tax=Sus scrofa TaxID=9823 RepID=A0A8W4FL29_PIG
MIEDTMTLLSLLGRIMRYFLLRPETLFLLCISLALWSYFFHTDEVKTIVKSSRDAVKMVKGKVAEIMQNDRLGGLDVLEAEFSKTWEFKSHNVAVYSIQGRRDHMEDRFEVLTDLANKTHPSIFGIFDGHGGETAAEYVKSRLPEVLKQHLQDYEKDKENSVLSYQTILEQQILSIDREMLEKLTVSYDEAALFTIAKTWKQPRCPSTEEWIQKRWYRYTMEYYSAIKKNEILTFLATWMDLEIIMLSEVSQTMKHQHQMLSLTCGI